MSETLTLGQLENAERLQFGDGYRTKKAELSDTGFRIIRVADVQDNSIKLDSPDFVRFDFGLQIGQKRAVPGDVLLTTKGTVGRVAIVPELRDDAVYSPQLCWFRVSDNETILSRFLSYWFQSQQFTSQSSYLQSNTDMAPYISLSDLRKIEISLPPLPEQRAIAEVLGALDDKIAANTRLAATAESYLRAEVDARWLKHPERDSVLSDYVELNPKLKLRSDVAEPIYIDMKRLPESGWTVRGVDNRPAKGGARFANGDTLLARITPCLQNRKTGYVDDLESGEVGIGSTEFIVMRSLDGIAPPISFLLATESRFREYSIQQMIGTSGRQRVAASALFGFEMPTPDKTWLDEFGVRAESLFVHVRSLNRENQTLAETRDALLPKLMSGQLRVRDAERIASEVGA